jgi:DNA repair exonuclease SbcCD ATPase subunit
MLIKKAQIDGFGKFVNTSFKFGPGLNIVFGPNESGKTTLAKFLLYTLGKPSNEALKYRPWGHNIFGGYLETSDGKYVFGEDNSEVPKYDINLLESVAFIMEDDELEAVKVDRGILESTLKKKTEKTSEGRILREAIKRVQTLDLNKCLVALSEEIRKTEEMISGVEEKINKKNTLFVKTKNVEKRIKDLEEQINASENNLEELRTAKKSELETKISQLKRNIEAIETELTKYLWIESLDTAVVEEAQNLIYKLNSIKTRLEALETEQEKLKEVLQKKDRNIEEKLKQLGVSSVDDLESVGLRLKHLSLLTKMYNERVGNVVDEDPLWKLFLENENILEQAEEEEQRYKETINETESTKLSLQNEIERNEQTAKYSKDLSIVSASAGIVLFVLGLLFKGISLFMYTPAVVFLALAVFLMFNWKRKMAFVEVLQERLVEVSMKQPQQPSVWKVLANYGITNIKQLRKKYTEFLEWKAQNVERQRILNELKDIEHEVIKELLKFGVTGSAQMIVSAVENLQRTFGEVQELLYEKESLERRLSQLRGEYLSVQREYKTVAENLDEILGKFGITKEQVETFKSHFEHYQELKNAKKTLSAELQKAVEERENEDLDPSISQTKATLRELYLAKDALLNEFKEMKNLYEGIEIDFKQLQALVEKLEESKLKAKIISNLINEIPEINKFLNERLTNFIESYHKIFSDEFARLFVKVSGVEKNFVVLPDLSVRLIVEGDMKDPNEFLSGSTKDLLIFCIKNAIYKTFYDGSLPLVIDNTLIRLDDDRLKRVCAYLNEESELRQIILMTSDRRVLEFFSDKKNVILLEG